MDPLEQLAIIWIGALCAVLLARRTGLTPVLYCSLRRARLRARIPSEEYFVLGFDFSVPVGIKVWTRTFARDGERATS